MTDFQKNEVQGWKDEKEKSDFINVVMLADDNVELVGSNNVNVTFGEDKLPVTFEAKPED